ncbi:Uncharacterised protein [Mycobacteroides abscessus subsp. abscessus]|nr:Uncharacterised protein [Mycobacteroides abscessus subsp. abscessus]
MRPMLNEDMSIPSVLVTSAPNSTAISESRPSSGTGTVRSMDSAATPITVASCSASM